MAKLERANFGSRLGIILATAGSAVGLGNVWRFPYMTGQNGGAVFILIYLGCVLLLGIPCMISEFIIGRHAQANTARAYLKVGGRNPLSLIGYMSVLTGFLTTGYYAVGLVPAVYLGFSRRTLGRWQPRLLQDVFRAVLRESCQADLLDAPDAPCYLPDHRAWGARRY